MSWEAAAILAGTQLLGGLLGQKAQQEMAERQNIMNIGATQFGLEQKAQQEAQQGQIGALGNLIEAYRSALLGGSQ